MYSFIVIIEGYTVVDMFLIVSCCLSSPFPNYLHLSYLHRLRELVLFSLGDEKAPGTPHCGLSVPKENLKNMESDFLHGQIGIGQGEITYKLREGRFRVGIRKFFSVRVVEC